MAIRSEEKVSKRRGLAAPVFASAPGQIWPITTIVWDQDYFKSTTFHQDLSSRPTEEIENMKV